MGMLDKEAFVTVAGFSTTVVQDTTGFTFANVIPGWPVVFQASAHWSFEHSQVPVLNVQDDLP